MLSCQAIEFSYGKRALLKGIDLTVATGEIVGLTGANGAGKTTLMSLLSGKLMPSRGRVLWNGSDVTKFPTYQRARLGVGFLPQHATVLNNASVEQNLRLVRELLPMEPPPPTVDEVLRQLGLESLIEARAGTLSGGERRRLELARAFLIRPKILILDEPFAGLDAESIQSLCGQLREFRGSLGILLSDHRIDLVENLATRSFCLIGGKVQEASVSKLNN
jgi:lipopolysaccharide export system ATP-binding protein